MSSDLIDPAILAVKELSTTTTTTLTSTGTAAAAASVAVVAVGPPKHRYSREELLNLRDVPLSQRKPDFFDVNEV